MARNPESDLVAGIADDIMSGDHRRIERLFVQNGVMPPTLSWDEPTDAIASASLDFLLDFWRTRRADRPWPEADQIEPVDLRPMLGNLLVCEPVDGASDFRIRLYGSRLALLMERDLTGTMISEFEPGGYITDFYLACYRAVYLRGAALFTRHTPSTQAFSSDIRRILLPFGPESGITRILTGVESVPRRPLNRPGWDRR